MDLVKKYLVGMINHGTRWKICWIPLGGYVKFFGDRNVFSQADHEKILKQYNKEDQEKLFVIKTIISKSFNCIWWSFS